LGFLLQAAENARARREGWRRTGAGGGEWAAGANPAAAGDDPAYVSEQLGHEDPRFTLRVYGHAAKRRQRLTGSHREQFDKAIEWARMGTSDDLSLTGVVEAENVEARNPAV
jgi:hypothetical protein